PDWIRHESGRGQPHSRTCRNSIAECFAKADWSAAVLCLCRPANEFGYFFLEKILLSHFGHPKPPWSLKVDSTTSIPSEASSFRRNTWSGMVERFAELDQVLDGRFSTSIVTVQRPVSFCHSHLSASS